MRGSIVRRKDRFYVVTDIPPGPDGKRKPKWHGTTGIWRGPDA